LIACYELYETENYEQSLLEIENIIKSMDTLKLDELFDQYLSAYIHIARATNAYIALTLNRDYEKVNINYRFINLDV